jgi:hypothetical protein
VVIPYTSASNLVFRLAGEEPPAQLQRGPPPSGTAAQQGGGQPAPRDGLEALLARAEQQVKGWQSVTLQLPRKPDAPVVFSIDLGNGGQPQLRSQLTLDRKTGEIVRWEPYSNNTAGGALAEND